VGEPAEPIVKGSPEPKEDGRKASSFVLSHTQPTSKPKQIFNLSELLAQHSSSRIKLNKRKDN
jgi:hypothetical protein